MIPQSPSDHQGSPESLTGQVIVFSGKLTSLTRTQARALVRRLGGSVELEITPSTTMVVIGADREDGAARVPSGESDAGPVRVREGAALANGTASDGVQTVSERDFCGLAGIPSDGSLARRFYALKDIRGMYPGIREDQLRYLERLGLTRPVIRAKGEAYYSFPDLLVIRQACAEMTEGTSFGAVVRSLVSASQGQLELDFRPPRGESHPAKVVSLQTVSRSRSRETRVVATPQSPTLSPAARHFLEGSALDDGEVSRVPLAERAYRTALTLDPNLVPALVNLANIHYARDALIEAHALYERALGLDPDCFEAHFNLGNIHHDLGRYSDAELSYRDALVLNPTYAEAHFYLAVTLEKMGRSSDAKVHWLQYRQLAPDGEWVELAAEFSE